MAPLGMNEGTTTVLEVGYNKLTNSCSAEDPAKRTFLSAPPHALIMPAMPEACFDCNSFYIVFITHCLQIREV
jgi:hypothetical protein